MLKSYIEFLLIQAEKKHAIFEQDVLGGQRDKYWAHWYAEFIHNRIKSDQFNVIDHLK